jgi:hypothetical protein
MTAGGDERLVGEVQSVLVTYDYDNARPMPVPDDWRRRMGEHEGHRFENDAA